MDPAECRAGSASGKRLALVWRLRARLSRLRRVTPVNTLLLRRLILRPGSGNPIDLRDAYRMVARIATAADIPRHISPHSLRHAAIANALDAGVPL